MTKPVGDLGELQLQFWANFVDYCKAVARDNDIALRKPLAQNWYDVPVNGTDYHLSYTVTRSKYLTLQLNSSLKLIRRKLKRKLKQKKIR